MPTNEIRLLAIGDVHLGRRSGRIPRGIGVDVGRLDPAAALNLAVKEARAHDVAAVLLAGDVVDSNRNVLRAVHLLAGAVAVLKEAGIAVYAVAGNHDATSLPQAGDLLRDLRIIGREGQWEEITIADAVRVRGWSFPDPSCPVNPLTGFPPLPPGPPVIGLLHADLGARNSRYAPVTVGDLTGAGAVRWLLGHLHQPTLSPDDPAPGYLGSLIGLDPTETGPHGPWLIRVRGEAVTLEHLSQAPLHWCRVELNVDDVAEPESELPDLVVQTLRELAASDEPGVAAAEAIGVRLHLTGRTADLAGLERARRQLVDTDFSLPLDQQVFFVDAVTSEVRPMHDLAALAVTDDLPGLLARELLAVESGTASALLEEAVGAVASVDHQTFLSTVAQVEGAPEPAGLRAMLLQSGYQLLDALLTSEGPGHGTA